MKATFLIINMLIAFTYIAQCQCPQPGLKIQSASCEYPNNLRVDTTTCSELKVQWQGRQNQTFKIQAESKDVTTSKTARLDASHYSCDHAGNCVATIAVKSGTVVNWSVQSICTQDGNSLPGYEVQGQPVTIPTCPAIVSNFPVIRVYPIPTTGILNITYAGQVTSSTVFSVYNIVGKKTLSISGSAISHLNGGYQLNLHGQLSGTYLLTISNGSQRSQTKFILVAER